MMMATSTTAKRTPAMTLTMIEVSMMCSCGDGFGLRGTYRVEERCQVKAMVVMRMARVIAFSRNPSGRLMGGSCAVDIG
jgi:hypothetical protein